MDRGEGRIYGRIGCVCAEASGSRDARTGDMPERSHERLADDNDSGNGGGE